MRKTIGDIIIRLREERGYTQEQLSQGLCTLSLLSKIELDQRVPDHFLLDRLFGRLGKSTERLEYVLSKEIYEIYELQYRIQTELLYRHYEEAERLLNEYESKKQADNSLHRQFAAQERAQLEWMRGGQTEKILMYLNKAIEETIPAEEAKRKNTSLSVEELKLLLFRWEVCCGTAYERSSREVWNILDYMEGHVYDGEEEVKAYPYAVLLLAKYAGSQTERKEMLRMTEKALELLRNEGKILFMPEILELYAELLEENGNQEEDVQELREMRKALLEVEEEFGVHYENYPLFQHLNRTFELDYELIKNSRHARKMSQEKLGADVCTQKTLSRIELGKCAPSNKNLKRLLEKLGRARERVEMNIAAEKYEQIALEREVRIALYRHNQEKTKELFMELQQQLDMSDIKNEQYVQSEQLRIDMWEKKYSMQKAIEKLYEILHMTLPGSDEEIFLYRLTIRECNILNQIASLFSENNQKEKGIAIWKELLKNYQNKGMSQVFNIRDYELITGNMSGNMEELGYVEEPINLCMERLKIAFEIGKGNEVGRSLAIIACVLERQSDKRCIERFRQTLNIYKLMKLNYRYQCVKKYIEEKGIYINV